MDTALTNGEIHINTKSFSETDNTKSKGYEGLINHFFYTIPQTIEQFMSATIKNQNQLMLIRKELPSSSYLLKVNYVLITL